MQPDFWLERWRLGQIGFHEFAPNQRLRTYWPELGIDPSARVFVPLCGKSLDLLWLAERGHEVSGVELSATAVEAFCMEHGIPATRRSSEGFDIFEAKRLRLFRGDFFALNSRQLGPVPVVYDRAALISWTPALRPSYVQHLTALTQPGTRTLLVTVEYPQTQMAGPPFSVSADEVQRLYAGTHKIELLGRHDALLNEARFKAKGVTEFHEACYRLTRL